MNRDGVYERGKRVCPTGPAGSIAVVAMLASTHTLTHGFWPSERILHGLHPIQRAHMHRPVQHLAEDGHVGVVVKRDGGRGWEAEDAHLQNKKKEDE